MAFAAYDACLNGWKKDVGSPMNVALDSVVRVCVSELVLYGQLAHSYAD